MTVGTGQRRFLTTDKTMRRHRCRVIHLFSIRNEDAGEVQTGEFTTSTHVRRAGACRPDSTPTTAPPINTTTP